MEKLERIKTYNFNGVDYVRKEDAATEIVTSFGHRGALYVMLRDVLSEEFGKEKAMQLLKKAIFKWGEYYGKKIKEQGGKTARDLADFWCGPLDALGLGYKEIESSQDHVKAIAAKCPHIPVWEDMGIPKEEWTELCEIADQVDLGMANVLNLKITVGKLLAKGDKFCEFTITTV
jgi:predicted hydrocarbon binding protein